MSDEASLAEEVQALARLDLEGLRQAWRQRFGLPPALRSTNLLRSILAWKIQAAELGGLDAETRRLLRQPGAQRGPRLELGVRIAREWKGVRHEAEVTEAGFVYAGKSYANLSAIARLITGTRWNGPRFFGLRQGERA